MTEPDSGLESYEGDFYEDDEPIEKIMAILDRGFDGVTASPDEAPDSPVTLNPSPWLHIGGRTGSHLVRRTRIERLRTTAFGLRFSGVAPS
jgi:hypothetical protein